MAASRRCKATHGIEPEAEFVEQAVAEQMRLVDDDQGMAAALDKVREGVVETFAESTRVERGADVPGGEDVSEKSLDGDVGIGQVGGEVEIGVEGLDERSDGGRFTCSNIAGDERREVILDGEGETGLDLLVRGGGEEVAHGQRLVKGQAQAAVEITECFGHR